MGNSWVLTTHCVGSGGTRKPEQLWVSLVTHCVTSGLPILFPWLWGLPGTSWKNKKSLSSRKRMPRKRFLLSPKTHPRKSKGNPSGEILSLHQWVLCSEDLLGARVSLELAHDFRRFCFFKKIHFGGQVSSPQGLRGGRYSISYMPFILTGLSLPETLLPPGLRQRNIHVFLLSLPNHWTPRSERAGK